MPSMSFRPVVRFWATGFFVIGALLAEIPFGQTLGWTQSVSPGAESTSIDLSPVFISRTARDKIDYSVIDHFTRRRQLSDDGDAAARVADCAAPLRDEPLPAQAPLPQARVSPTPLSQTLRRIRSPLSMTAHSTLVRSGKAAALSSSPAHLVNSNK